MQNQQDIARVRDWISQADRIAVLTGAGISAESGVSTFRGADGLWRNFRPEVLATAEAFTKDPRLVWEWYDWRRGLVADKVPNPGHLALSTLERMKTTFTLITQNVDGLHDLAGSTRPLKLHGDIWHIRCTSCAHRSVNRESPLRELPPRCRCGALLRPDIVWFGEMLPEQVLTQAWVASESADLFLVVGTSALVRPAASLPLAAREHGARVVEINLEATPLSRYTDISLFGPSGEILPLLVADH